MSPLAAARRALVHASRDRVINEPLNYDVPTVFDDRINHPDVDLIHVEDAGSPNGFSFRLPVGSA